MTAKKKPETGRSLERPVKHTGKWFLTAALDALGWTRADIAAHADVAEETISRWRSEEDYVAEREKHVVALRADLSRLREVAIARTDVAAVKAQEWAITNLSAQDADGNQLFSVQKAAAEILVKLALAGVLASGKAQLDGGEQPGHAGGIVHIHLGEGARVEHVEMIEGEVTEEADDDTDRDGVGAADD